MLLSDKNRELLRRILGEIQEKVEYGDGTLHQIYSHLWENNPSRPLPEDDRLQESINYLFILIKEDGLSTPEQIWEYFSSQRRKADVEVKTIIQRVDAKRLLNAVFGAGRSYNKIAYRK